MNPIYKQQHSWDLQNLMENRPTFSPTKQVSKSQNIIKNNQIKNN